MPFINNFLFPALAIFVSLSSHASEIKQINYEGFTVWIDCEKRGAVKFQYTAQHDTGNFKRKTSFYYDPDLPKDCQQNSTKIYKKKGQRYDRGHRVALVRIKEVSAMRHPL